jgi:hypothetical protein
MGYTVSWEQLPHNEYVYNKLLTILPKVLDEDTQFKIEPWGFIVGNNENESFVIEKYPSVATFTKTNRLPYTKEVMKTLILMAEFSLATMLEDSDDNRKAFLGPLEEVQSKYTLDTYEKQKSYFNM